jgi:hypothetical protein
MTEPPAQLDWLRIGVALSGSAAVAYAAARHMGLIGERQGRKTGASARSSAFEGKALDEVRLHKQAPRASPIPIAPVLLSNSEAVSHRGYR